MACEGTYIGECCDHRDTGEVTVNLIASFVGYSPFSWPTYERQFARYSGVATTVTDLVNGGRAEQRGSIENGQYVGTYEVFGNYDRFPRSFFVYYEGSITETSIDLTYYTRDSDDAPLTQTPRWKVSATMSGGLSFAWDRALARLRQLSFAGINAGDGHLWRLLQDGNLIGPSPGFASVGGFCSTTTNPGPVFDGLPPFGVINSFNFTDDENEGWKNLVPNLGRFSWTRPPDTVNCGKSLIVDSGWGREQRFWQGHDAGGIIHPRTRYYCVGNIPPFSSIELFPDLSPAPGFNRFDSVANFYPVQQLNPCNLP